MAKGRYEYWLTSEGLTLLRGWARQGLSDEQIAHNVGVSRKTLSAWKVKYGDIGDTLKKGKQVADFEVENALFKRATGFTTVEETEELVKDVGLTVTKRVTKYVAPDTAAMIYWLKVRDPKHWQENLTTAQVKKIGADAAIAQAQVDEAKASVDKKLTKVTFNRHNRSAPEGGGSDGAVD